MIVQFCPQATVPIPGTSAADIALTQSIPTNLEDAVMDSIPGPANIEIGLVDTAMAQLDTTNTGYRQTLSTFSTVVNGIIRVCHPSCGRSSLTDDRA